MSCWSKISGENDQSANFQISPLQCLQERHQVCFLRLGQIQTKALVTKFDATVEGRGGPL